jgi:hypothetical protein
VLNLDRTEGFAREEGGAKAVVVVVVVVLLEGDEWEEDMGLFRVLAAMNFDDVSAPTVLDILPRFPRLAEMAVPVAEIRPTLVLLFLGGGELLASAILLLPVLLLLPLSLTGWYCCPCPCFIARETTIFRI